MPDDVPVMRTTGWLDTRRLHKEYRVRAAEVSPALSPDYRNRGEAHLGEPVNLPDGAVVTSGPTTCPVCRAMTVEWAASAVQLERDQIHPIFWHETEWLADSFICTTCDAGWYEPDDPEPVRWVRPYWVIS